MICIIMLLEKKGRKSVGHAYVPACNSKTNKRVFLLKKSLLNLSLPMEQLINVLMREAQIFVIIGTIFVEIKGK